MNFDGFDFDEKTMQTLNTLDAQSRLPHAIIIESKDKQKSLELAVFLSMYAVCASQSRPCTHCAQCLRAKSRAHADIKYAYPEKKSKSYSVEQIRAVIKEAYIKPNEANGKVYIFEDAENRLTSISQNAFLKLFEEPPQNVYFILLCENSKKLLSTILSRAVVLRLSGEASYGGLSIQNAQKIAEGILSSREYDLLFALNCLCEKEFAQETLTVLRLILRDGVALSSGARAVLDEELGKTLSTRFTRTQLMEMADICEDAKLKITQNININLLTTWLCGEFRRISWQR